MQAIEQRNAAHARHADIGNEDIRLTVFYRLKQVFRAFEAARLHVCLPQRFFEHPANRLVIVDHPDIQAGTCHWLCTICSSGTRTKNTVRPGRLSNSIRPL